MAAKINTADNGDLFMEFSLSLLVVYQILLKMSSAQILLLPFWVWHKRGKYDILPA